MTLSLAGVALSIALTAALAAVVLGRNLTASLVAAIVSLLALAIALLALGAGYVALVTITSAALGLAMIQLFGWMLVDIDRDHLPPTDGATRLARSLAFLLLGGGLALLAYGVTTESGFPVADANLGSSVGVLGEADPTAIGALLFGSWQELGVLLGLTIAASLLATLLMLQDDRPSR